MSNPDPSSRDIREFQMPFPAPQIISKDFEMKMLIITVKKATNCRI